MNKQIQEFVRRDFMYIVVVLLALFACLYTLGSVKEYNNQCNAHWEQQIKDAGGFCLARSMDMQNHSEAFKLPYIELEIYDGKDS